MSWPRRHELIDLDLDAYPDDETQPVEPVVENVVEQKPMSLLEAAERAGIPLDVLLPKLDF